MSNSIAHIVVAHEIISAKPTLIQYPQAYYLGALAPDTIGSMPSCTRDDKKRVHLRDGIRDADWLTEDKMRLFDHRVRQFVQAHILPPSLCAEQRDFNTGYLVHLLTDKWNHKTIRQTMLRIANERGIHESDREFFHMMTNDLEALDHYLLCVHPSLKTLFNDTIRIPVRYALPGYIETDYIEGSIRWWKNHYLPSIQNRSLLYISESDINHFVTLAAKEIIAELDHLRM